MSAQNPDPVELAEWQLSRDQARTARFPDVLPRKIRKMAASPFSYLRGAAPLFYKLLADHPELGDGPAGSGWICGDAHLENFGAFRADDEDDEVVVFDLNDFDETAIAPFRFDLLRLSTSLVLGGRELGVDGIRTLELAKHLLDAHAQTCFGGAPLPKRPSPVERLLQKVKGRSHRDMLSSRTKEENGRRRFVIGERYAVLPPELTTAASLAFREYVRALGPKDPGRFDVVDVAFRVAGTGSLGQARIAVLTRGKGGPDGGWLFDMKEETESAVPQGGSGAATSLAGRVLLGLRACIERPPRMTGTTSLDGMSMVVRRLAPQEDKLDFTRIDPGDLESVAAYLGALLGRAHRRGANGSVVAEWSESDRSALLDRTVRLAGIHEAAYLAFCRRASDLLGAGGTARLMV